MTCRITTLFAAYRSLKKRKQHFPKAIIMAHWDLMRKCFLFMLTYWCPKQSHLLVWESELALFSTLMSVPMEGWVISNTAAHQRRDIQMFWLLAFYICTGSKQAQMWTVKWTVCSSTANLPPWRYHYDLSGRVTLSLASDFLSFCTPKK